MIECSTTPDWFVEDYKLDNFKYDSVNLDKFTLDDAPILIDDKTLIKKHGVTNSHNTHSGFWPDSLCNKRTKENSDQVILYFSSDYKGYSFASFDNQNKLLYIDFKLSDKKIKYNDLIFSPDFKVNDIDNYFPHSDYYRNQYPDYLITMNLVSQFLDSTKVVEMEQDGYDYIYLDIIDENCDPGIELTFVKNKLRYMYFLP